jgi:glycosyltransferase involved in cell wall biosynthesis
MGTDSEDFVPKVSVVIPAKNEEMNIGLVLDDLNRTIEQCRDYDFEVIVVDDKSTDTTSQVASSRGARVIRNDGPSGKGRALRVGFAHSTGDTIIMMDADYSHRAEEIPRLLADLKDGAGLVIGSRVYGGSDEYTPIRALGNVFLTYALGAFTGRYLSDALNGLKAFRREVFDDFVYTSKFFEIEIELIFNTLRKSYQVHEIRSHERARLGGEAKSRVIRHGTRFFIRIFTEWLRNKGALRSHARPQETQVTPPLHEKPAAAEKVEPAAVSARNSI